MKRWLALNRWRLVLLLACVVVPRIVAAVAVNALATEFANDSWIWLVIATLWDIGLCILVMLTVVAFVQYGRIFNPRIPTE